MKRIGIIGAGIMAAGIAQNFLKHGYKVTVWNRSQERLQPLLEAGASQAESPRAATEQADIVIECVSDDAASKDVWLSEDGILSGATTDKVLIASSSLSLGWTDELAAMCQQKGLQFLDMPLTGSRAGAENGTLRLLVGGEATALESIRKDLEVISEKIYHFGKAGAGMRFKLALNSLIGIHMNAAAQARELAHRAGIDPGRFAHALIDGAMGPASPSTKLVFDSANWEPDHVNFAVQWLEKDLRYARDMAEKYGYRFDLLDATQTDYAKALDAGHGESDVTSIAKIFTEDMPPASAKHNQIDLIEFPVESAEKLSQTQAFFTNVFGWKYTNWGDSYADTAGSGASSGINSDGTSSMPLTVVYSEDLEKTKELVVQHGGTVIVDTYDFPGGRRFHFTEPNGNELAVWSQ